MMNLVDSVINTIKVRKHRAETGEINCLPFPIEHITDKFPGLEQSSYLLITGASKAGKSQIANFLVLYNSIIYAYNHPQELRVKFLYFPLEESREIITLRFISYLLYIWYGKRVSPLELRSSNRSKPLPDEILQLIQGTKMTAMLQFFADRVDFYEDAHTSVDISIAVEKYANTHGVTVYSNEQFLDEESGEVRHLIDHYEPADPDEYVFVLTDHVNLLNPTKKEVTMLNAITNFSKKMVTYKNRYRYIIVALQQQVDSETNGLEAIKMGNILATKAGLKDCKSTGQDCTLMWGISNPGASVPAWQGYNLDLFRRKYFRVFQIILNRFGEGDITVPLYFDGAINYYEPLPAPNEEMKLIEYYKKLGTYKR